MMSSWLICSCLFKDDLSMWVILRVLRAINVASSKVNMAAPLKVVRENNASYMLKIDLIWEQGLCRCDFIEALEIRRYSWIFWVGSKSMTTTLTRERQREVGGTPKRRKCDHGGRGGRDVATSQVLLTVTRSWEGQRKNSPLEPLEAVRPSWHLDFRRLASRMVST